MKGHSKIHLWKVTGCTIFVSFWSCQFSATLSASPNHITVSTPLKIRCIKTLGSLEPSCTVRSKARSDRQLTLTLTREVKSDEESDILFMCSGWYSDVDYKDEEVCVRHLVVAGWLDYGSPALRPCNVYYCNSVWYFCEREDCISIKNTGFSSAHNIYTHTHIHTTTLWQQLHIIK